LLALAVAGAALVSGCAGGLTEDERARAVRIASEAGFTTTRVPVDGFQIYSAYKGRRGAGDTLVVYIEGDGRAYLNRYTLSSDPTPGNPIALKLAVEDPSPLVAYLSRPCQYRVEGTRDHCHPRLWAMDRFAPEAVAAESQAVDYYKSLLGARRVVLIGYSGGGAVAALVAAQRDDVARLITVGGPLDHARWTQLHDLTPLSGSLNPADYAAHLESLPQTHLVGGDDDTVPIAVARSYCARMRDASQCHIQVVDGYDHDCCWVRGWRGVLARLGPPS